MPVSALLHVPMPRWVIVGLYAWSLHATMAPFYILVVAPAIAFMVRRAVSRQREFLADADAVVLTRDPEGLALALTKIGAAHGTLRSAESIAHLFIAPPRPSDRWFDRLFPTHPAIESRIDVLARMGSRGWAGLRWEERSRQASGTSRRKPRKRGAARPRLTVAADLDVCDVVDGARPRSAWSITPTSSSKAIAPE